MTGGKRRRQAGRERVDPAEAVPEGRWIVTASQFTVGLWDAATGQLVFYLGRHPRTLTGASFSPSGNWILTGSEDGTARVRLRHLRAAVEPRGNGRRAAPRFAVTY